MSSHSSVVNPANNTHRGRWSRNTPNQASHTQGSWSYLDNHRSLERAIRVAACSKGETAPWESQLRTPVLQVASKVQATRYQVFGLLQKLSMTAAASSPWQQSATEPVQVSSCPGVPIAQACISCGSRAHELPVWPDAQTSEVCSQVAGLAVGANGQRCQPNCFADD